MLRSTSSSPSCLNREVKGLEESSQVRGCRSRTKRHQETKAREDETTALLCAVILSICFPHMSPINSDSFAERDLQLKESMINRAVGKGYTA